MKMNPILVSAVTLLATLAFLAGCGSNTPKIQIIEQNPSSPPGWYEDGGLCENHVDFPEAHECFIGKGTRHGSLDRAEAQAKSNAADQVVSFGCGDLVDGQIDEILNDGVGSEPDIRTVDLARTVVTIGETFGGVKQYQTYWRHYVMSTEPDRVLYDYWCLYDVDTGAFANELAAQLEEAAQERAGAVREKLQERADRLRENRWREIGE